MLGLRRPLLCSLASPPQLLPKITGHTQPLIVVKLEIALRVDATCFRFDFRLLKLPQGITRPCERERTSETDDRQHRSGSSLVRPFTLKE